MRLGRCNGEGDRPGCLGVADPRYEMRFDDLGEPPLQWCAACGPEACAINDALQRAFATRPGFAAELESALDAEQARRN